MKKHGLILIGMLLSTSVFADNSLRCGGSIISVGDTKAELLMKCGTAVSVVDSKSSLVENTNGSVSMVTDSETLMVDMGKNKIMMLVTVRDGVIKKIENGPRND